MTTSAVYDRNPPVNLDSAILAITEPQHGEHLSAVWEHGEEWVTCNRCGRQWSVHGSDAEVISEGDGYCDEQGEDE